MVLYILMTQYEKIIYMKEIRLLTRPLIFYITFETF